MSDIKTLFFGFVAWCEAHPAASTVLATFFVAFVGWITGAIGWILSKFSSSKTSAGASAEVNGANSGVTVGHAETVHNTSNDPELIKHFVDIQNDQIVRLQDELKGANSDKESLHREIAELQQRIANPEDYIEAALKTSDQTLERLTRLSNEVDADKLQQAKDAAKKLDFSEAEQIFNDIKNRNELAVQQSAAAEMGLGDIAEQQVRWHDAYAHYKRAYGLTKDINALEGYSRMAWRLGKHQESLELDEIQLSHAKDTYGEESEQVAAALNNLALMHQNLGQFDKAESLYHQAIEITRKTIGEDHPSFAMRLNNLASLYWHMGRYEEAEPLYHQAIKITRKTIGEDHPDFAIGLNNLAGLYEDMGRYAEAEPLFHQAMEIDRKALGEDHPLFATDLNNLGVLYYHQERFSEAVPLLRQALAIQEAKLPEGHPDTEGTRRSLEILYALHPELRD